MNTLEKLSVSEALNSIKSFDYEAMYVRISEKIKVFDISESQRMIVLDTFNNIMVKEELPKLDKAVEWLDAMKTNN